MISKKIIELENKLVDFRKQIAHNKILKLAENYGFKPQKISTSGSYEYDDQYSTVFELSSIYFLDEDNGYYDFEQNKEIVKMLQDDDDYWELRLYEVLDVDEEKIQYVDLESLEISKLLI